MAEENLDDMIETLTVSRNKTTLATASSTKPYPITSEYKHPQARCFVSIKRRRQQFHLVCVREIGHTWDGSERRGDEK
jgi:hypothetical protein